MSAISFRLGSLNGLGSTGTLPLRVRETVYSAYAEVRKWVGLRFLLHRNCLGVVSETCWMVSTTRKRLTESLDVQGELLLVFDQCIDLAAVWGDSTLG
jgi:hypothetical protein